MRVAIADDSALFRDGLCALLVAAEVEVIHQAATAPELFKLIQKDTPDVVITDVCMPPTFTEEGLELAESIKHAFPDVGVLVLSTYNETAYAARLFRQGEAGRGYLLKDRVDIAAVRDAVQRLADGESVVDPAVVQRLLKRPKEAGPLDSLTTRELAVLGHMAEGRSNAAIGRLLFLSPKTVEAHISSLLNKLGIPLEADSNRRVLAVLTWLRRGDI